ncbi:MAG TPA: glutamate racemase [bacterium]|nr:glutamate racemase [bacterium]
MKASARPIGVFDSGVGGLTVARELLRQLPGEKLIYLGDTARTPYGNKSPQTLIRFALETGTFLARRGVKMLVVACNSSSAYSLGALRERLNIPVVGVIEAGARAAVAGRRGRPIGVIGTRATVRSGAYARAIHALDPRARVVAQACPLFVPLVEEGWTGHALAAQVAQEYLRPLKREKVESVVLGCTHYPLLKTVLAKVLGRDIALVDSAKEVAREVKTLLKASGLASPLKTVPFKQHLFFVTDPPEQFAGQVKRFLGRQPDIRPVRLAELPAK